MIVACLFTKSNGQPATGLTLTDIDIYLYARAKSGGAVTTVWNGENPTGEVGGGIYARYYSSADCYANDYFAYAHYTGSTTLDVDYALQFCPMSTPGEAGTGAIQFTYTLTSTADGSAIADADVWVTTDEAGNNTVASGTTDDNGQVVFYLDAGTYYLWRQKSGWTFTNPDTETVS